MSKPLLFLLAAACWCSSTDYARAEQAGTLPVQSAAEAAQAALTRCLLESASVEDRSSLVKWIFLVMTRYPGLSDMARIEDKERERFNTDAGVVFERLMTVDCKNQLQTALRKSGTEAIGKSFETLGQTAMATLLENPAVQAETGSIMKHIDMDRLSRTLGEKAQ